MSTLGALSQAWTSAEAALPVGWEIVALVKDRETAEWIASAAAPGVGEVGRSESGVGGHHYQALNNLAIRLRELRGPTTG